MQAQELAFFSSLKEEKGLNTIARLSLGLVSLLQSARNIASQNFDYDLDDLVKKLEKKTDLHTFIHCLIMAEFWNNQELYEIAHDLYTTSYKILKNLENISKNSIEDYLNISILRSEKECQQISYEGKKASESQTTLEPYFIANLLDFKLILKPYSSSYTSIFSQIYPLHIIEAQSEFEAKSNAILITLQNSAEKIDSEFNDINIKICYESEGFVIELRRIIFNDEVIRFKNLLTDIQEIIDEVGTVKNMIELKDYRLKEKREIQVIFGNLECIQDNMDKYKVKLLFNDNTLIQTMIPLFDEFYSKSIKMLKDKVFEFNNNSEKRSNLIKNLKNEVFDKIK